MSRDRGIQLRTAGLLDTLMVGSQHTNRSLAEAVGCSHQMIGALRSGARTRCLPCLAARIAEALDVRIDALFLTSPADESVLEIQGCPGSGVMT